MSERTLSGAKGSLQEGTRRKRGIKKKEEGTRRKRRGQVMDDIDQASHPFGSYVRYYDAQLPQSFVSHHLFLFFNFPMSSARI